MWLLCGFGVPAPRGDEYLPDVVQGGKGKGDTLTKQDLPSAEDSVVCYGEWLLR